MEANTNDAFGQEVTRLRVDYQRKRQGSNLFPPAGQPVLEMELVPGETLSMRFWFEDGTKLGRYVRLFDLPGTLSGDILRLERNLPSVQGHFEIEGDVVRSLDQCPDHPRAVEDDFEDVSDLVAQLPIINVDSSKHFLKKAKYQSEIENLLKCQGGSCPGTSFSEHLIRLLGASPDGHLVFEKLMTRGALLSCFSSLDIYKRWILHIIDALAYLHSVGIVHRDLRIDNCLFTRDGSHLVVCDLESRWGQRAAPEITFNGGLNSGWTTRSDIYDIGNCIKCMVYANAPITNQVEWPVPQPLQAIVDACMRKVPGDRPTLLELKGMVESITTSVN
ncbi:hypothetical protein GL218_00240 [Daldinia childiae]|uniref:uncharacterized protein n=1 Tax=Daldinia childiae TaxID=326645 RepID=UPI001444F049|nr:uncharacterized protein GL218_00240 [Daldinia childiae]KAF3070402.1 hypothetical protein GL218_00240 [Daldinia childiae]